MNKMMATCIVIVVGMVSLTALAWKYNDEYTIMAFAFAGSTAGTLLGVPIFSKKVDNNE